MSLVGQKTSPGAAAPCTQRALPRTPSEDSLGAACSFRPGSAAGYPAAAGVPPNDSLVGGTPSTPIVNGAHQWLLAINSTTASRVAPWATAWLCTNTLRPAAAPAAGGIHCTTASPTGTYSDARRSEPVRRLDKPKPGIYKPRLLLFLALLGQASGQVFRVEPSSYVSSDHAAAPTSDEARSGILAAPTLGGFFSGTGPATGSPEAGPTPTIGERGGHLRSAPPIGLLPPAPAGLLTTAPTLQAAVDTLKDRVPQSPAFLAGRAAPIQEPAATNIANAAPRGANTPFRRLAHYMHMLSAAAAVFAIVYMVPGQGGKGGGRGGGSRRDPPYWAPERESSYPYRHYMQDLIAWSILNTDLDPSQQTAAIVLQLGGAARELARNMTFDQITNGGDVNGTHTDSVTYLLANLAQNFAPLGEEQRLTAMSELMSFHRNPGEQIDTLLSRFMTLRYRAEQGGAGMTMSWEGYAWLVLKACGTNSQQLLQLLQPYQGRFPNTAAEYNALTMSLRRMGHILEGAPGNISNQLRNPPSRGFFNETFVAMDADPWQSPNSDPWQQSRDPWQGSVGVAQYAGSSTWNPVIPAAHPTPAAAPASAFMTEVDDDTDSETVSTTGNPDYSDPNLQGLTPSQLDEQLFSSTKRVRRTGENICIVPLER